MLRTLRMQCVGGSDSGIPSLESSTRRSAAQQWSVYKNSTSSAEKHRLLTSVKCALVINNSAL